MLIDLTYRCNMGCNHCMSDCKPNGTDMTPEILKDVLAPGTAQDHRKGMG